MSEIQSLARGLKILDKLFELSQNGDACQLGITELATELEINKSSASRLVQTLTKYGYVEKSNVSRSLKLGTKLRQGSQQVSRAGLREQARPFLYQLMKVTGESSHTAIFAQGQALIIDDVESAASLRVSGGLGRVGMLHCTAVGKCLLAFQDIPIPKALVKLNERTITVRAKLTAHLEDIREAGYAFDDEENDDSVRCLAAPVYDTSGHAIACIGISGPSVRMTLVRIPVLAAQVMESSRELSHFLGYQPAHNG